MIGKNLGSSKKRNAKLENLSSRDMSVALQNHLLNEINVFADKYEKGMTVSEVLRSLGLLTIGYSNVLIDSESEMGKNADVESKNTTE